MPCKCLAAGVSAQARRLARCLHCACTHACCPCRLIVRLPSLALPFLPALLIVVLKPILLSFSQEDTPQPNKLPSVQATMRFPPAADVPSKYRCSSVRCVGPPPCSCLQGSRRGGTRGRPRCHGLRSLLLPLISTRIATDEVSKMSTRSRAAWQHSRSNTGLLKKKLLHGASNLSGRYRMTVHS